MIRFVPAILKDILELGKDYPWERRTTWPAAMTQMFFRHIRRHARRRLSGRGGLNGIWTAFGWKFKAAHPFRRHENTWFFNECDKLIHVIGHISARQPSWTESESSAHPKARVKWDAAPLLQMGSPRPEVTGRIDEICSPTGTRSADRLFGGLNLVAFSDPNDLFSYTLPPRFLDEHLDSRICPSGRREKGEA